MQQDTFGRMLIYIPLFVAIVIVSPAFSNTIYSLRQDISSHNVPCEKEWYYFSNKCYKAMGQKISLSWNHASDRCKELGGDLVSINSREELDFIVAFLQLDSLFYAFIGLNDILWEGTYMWSDGSPFTFSNWNTGEPSGSRNKNEDCVELMLEPWSDIIGKWNDIPCTSKNAYICEKPTTSGKESPDQKYCSPKEGGGIKRKSSCFHVITEIDSWENAEEYCQDKLNGHLASIHDMLDDIFLNFVLSSIKKEVWIGIKIQEQFQQKWTSGWYVTYNGFGENSNLMEGACVARKKKKEWITLPCSTKLSFVCEVLRVMPNGVGGIECSRLVVHKALNGVFACIILVAILTGAVLYYFRTRGFEFLRRSIAASTEHSSASQNYPEYVSMTEHMVEKDSNKTVN